MRTLSHDQTQEITGLIAVGNRLQAAIAVAGVTGEELMQGLQDFPDWKDHLADAEAVAQIWWVSALGWPDV